MATKMRSGGLQHASSLGNIEASSKSHVNFRSYDSEDETMGRIRTAHSSLPRTSVYSKGDIREQYCLSDRQLSSIEPPRRERFFGCLSGRGAPQSFLGVCVGRRAPSDENLADYAPVYKYPRYPPPGSASNLFMHEDDTESSYFKRKPTSFLSNPGISGSSSGGNNGVGNNGGGIMTPGPTVDPKRYTWLSAAEEDAVRLEGPRSICPDIDVVGPYIVGSPAYPIKPQPQLSQSSEHLNGGGAYRCPAHTRLQSSLAGTANNVPKNILCNDGTATAAPGSQSAINPPTAPRIKHVSFARSHTLTSFDEAATRHSHVHHGQQTPTTPALHHHPHALTSTNQPTQQHPQHSPYSFPQMPTPSPQQQQPAQAMSAIAGGRSQFSRLGTPTRSQERLIGGKKPTITIQPTTAAAQLILQQTSLQMPPYGGLLQQQGQQQDVFVVEKIKRNVMKTQATQTDVQNQQKLMMQQQLMNNPLTLSPRTAQRVLMVSQSANTVAGLSNGRKLTKSLSEAANRAQDSNAALSHFNFNPQQMPRSPNEHEHLHRTYSEEPPKSPFEGNFPNMHVSRTPSRQSNFTETSRSDAMSSSAHHSRNPSAESGTSFRSTDFSSKDSVISFKPNAEIFDDMLSLEAYERPYYDTHSLPRKSCIHHRPEPQQQSQPQQNHTHSLPRREQHSHKPLCKHNQATMSSGTDHLQHTDHSLGMVNSPMVNPSAMSYDPYLCRNQQQMGHHRRMSHSIVKPEIHVFPRRNSVHQSSYQRPAMDDLISSRYVPQSTGSPQEEQEIFIDFKPRLSPPSPKSRKRGLLKTRSEGEILVDRRRRGSVQDIICPTSQSEEHLLKTTNHAHLDIDEDRFRYQCTPIKDEGIFDKQTFLMSSMAPHSQHLAVGRGTNRREHFRKRSISLDDQHSDVTQSKSLADSPEDIRDKSGFASTDSLSTDVTKEHSDNTSNRTESQITVLNNLALDGYVGGEATIGNGHSRQLSSQSQQRRRSLIQMNQGHSSQDTEGIDLDDGRVPVKISQMAQTTSPLLHGYSVQKNTGKPSLGLTTNVVRPIQTPAISVTPTRSHDVVEDEAPLVGGGTLRRPRSASLKKGDLLSHSTSKYRPTDQSCAHDEPARNIHWKPESSTTGAQAGTSNTTDISECSTNTEDYVTCTDNSKRTSQGIKPGGLISAATATQVPVSSSASYRSAVATVDGSSFESASSVYGMPTNLDAVIAAKAAATAAASAAASAGTSSSVDEGGDLSSSAKLQKRIPTKSLTPSSSRSSSASSSSSDTYNNTNMNMVAAATPTGKELGSRIKGSPSRTNVVTPIMVKHVAKFESVSDDEDKTESGIRGGVRRATTSKIDWNEEERHRRKGNLKLEFDESAGGGVSAGGKSMTSPKTKISTTFKKISPDDRTALNILDGASPSKTKRFRPKTRRSPRNRSTSGGDELLTPVNRRLKPNFTKSPTQSTAVGLGSSSAAATTMTKSNNLISPSVIIVGSVAGSAVKTNPSKYQSPQAGLLVGSAAAMKAKHLSPHGSPKKCSRSVIGTSPETRLKAISTESLRSVSPGSDSVFYSEADLALEHQVQCHHCGKEVDIVNAGPDSIASITDQSEADRPEIVQPPAGFADSPNGITKPVRLYKKVDKRFRSEERHGDRRHHRNRSDTRAKSEERGKEEEMGSSGIRPAGSSPCVGADEVQSRDKFGQQADPEQGIYHGLYRLGTWICIANQDVFRKHDLDTERPYEATERRGSTDSEKDFRKKYQALTHRLVHRRSCIEMYKRQSGNTFNFSAYDNDVGDDGIKVDSVLGRLHEIVRLMCMVWAKQGLANRLVSGGEKNATDKTVVVFRQSGEFGFRIHGSKPVVVSAIEPDTPAESSGLEVGDIVLAVNGTSVIDKSHSEVVKIAHAGSDTLELEVARTIDLLHPNNYDNTALYSGYLWRPCGYASGNPNMSKKWVRRWFTLRPDHCLYFYKSEHENQPVGAILLTNHTVERCDGEVSKPFSFKIDDNENPVLYLAGDSEEATNRWVAIMSHAAKQMDPWLELSTKNLRLAPGDVPRPDCFGYLMKLGSRWRSWNKRYCVLKDACLYFYQDGNCRNAFGMTCLQGYRVQPSNNYGGKKFAFEISPPEPKLRHYYFATESEMDKKRWIAALEYSIDRWMKAG